MCSLNLLLFLHNQSDSFLQSEIEDLVWRTRPPIPSSVCDLVSMTKPFVGFLPHLLYCFFKNIMGPAGIL
jgi:hypothetical protein